jgi:hypothetical protein
LVKICITFSFYEHFIIGSNTLRKYSQIFFYIFCFCLIFKKYKGVWYNYKEKTWQAHFVLYHNGSLKAHPLGNFDNAEEAAKAVNFCCQSHNIPHYNPSLPALESENQIVIKSFARKILLSRKENNNAFFVVDS